MLVGRMELPGLTIQPVPVETGTAKFDFSLVLEGWGRTVCAERSMNSMT